jgi:flagellar basal body-associated protein FliL
LIEKTKNLFVIALSYGGSSHSSSNFIIPLIISLVGLCLVILIGIFIIWFFCRKRNGNEKNISMKRPIDNPPMYSDTMNANNTFMVDGASNA